MHTCTVNYTLGNKEWPRGLYLLHALSVMVDSQFGVLVKVLNKKAVSSSSTFNTKAA